MSCAIRKRRNVVWEWRSYVLKTHFQDTNAPSEVGVIFKGVQGSI
jgi:hypothetical protein